MKHDITETVTFTKIRYTCDICGGCLLQGEKPYVCAICRAETCQQHIVWVEYMKPVWVCDPCACVPEAMDRTVWADEIYTKQWRHAVDGLFSYWREAARQVHT